MDFHYNETKTFVKRIPRPETKPKLGDELAQLVAQVETNWARIPESYRADVKREHMELFIKGWESLQIELIENNMRAKAIKGETTLSFNFYAPGRAQVLSAEDLGRMRSLMHFLSEQNISWKLLWEATLSSPMAVVTAKWA